MNSFPGYLKQQSSTHKGHAVCLTILTAMPGQHTETASASAAQPSAAFAALQCNSALHTPLTRSSSSRLYPLATASKGREALVALRLAHPSATSMARCPRSHKKIPGRRKIDRTSLGTCGLLICRTGARKSSEIISIPCGRLLLAWTAKYLGGADPRSKLCRIRN